VVAVEADVPDALPASPDEAQIARVQVAVIQLARQLKSVDDSGLAMSLRTALAALVKYGPLPAGRLAEIECVDPASMSRTLRALDSRGLIQRTIDPTDGRISLISASPAGVESFYRTRKQATTFLVDRLQDSGDEVVAQVAAAAPILELLVRLTA